MVGGGPGGLIAAERLVAAGVSVVLIEAGAAVGRKFLLAGRGGLNLTHSEAFERFLVRYGEATPRLRRALEAFTPDDLRAWCAELGEPTFVGSSGRVFPESFRANRLLEAWVGHLVASGVQVRTGLRWQGWGDDPVDVRGGQQRSHEGAEQGTEHGTRDGRRRFELLCEGESGAETIGADAMVLALGGASWPGTGSDGAWVPTLEHDGIAISPLRAANSGAEVSWTQVFADRFAGTPVKNVAVCCGGETVRGELMVTDHGLEGGAVYALSTALRRELDADGAAVLSIDLLPDLGDGALLARLARRRAKDSMATVLGRHVGLAPVAIGLLREATANRLPTDDASLVELLREVRLEVGATSPVERAISSAGGVSLDELDEQFMLRRRPGVFIAGEMLDWEAPTGGYLLQATFATGVAAAHGVLQWLDGIASAADRPQHDELG